MGSRIDFIAWMAIGGPRHTAVQQQTVATATFVA